MTFREDNYLFEATHYKRHNGSLKASDVFGKLVRVPLEDRLGSEGKNAHRASKLYL